MSKTPYPGYPPSYKTVDTTAGFKRTCIVLEILSLGPLESAHMAMLQEQLEALMARLSQQIPYLEKTNVVLPDRFDPVLKSGLRLS